MTSLKASPTKITYKSRSYPRSYSVYMDGECVGWVEQRNKGDWWGSYHARDGEMLGEEIGAGRTREEATWDLEKYRTNQEDA